MARSGPASRSRETTDGSVCMRRTGCGGNITPRRKSLRGSHRCPVRPAMRPPPTSGGSCGSGSCQRMRLFRSVMSETSCRPLQGSPEKLRTISMRTTWRVSGRRTSPSSCPGGGMTCTIRSICPWRRRKSRYPWGRTRGESLVGRGPQFLGT